MTSKTANLRTILERLERDRSKRVLYTMPSGEVIDLGQTSESIEEEDKVFDLDGNRLVYFPGIGFRKVRQATLEWIADLDKYGEELPKDSEKLEIYIYISERGSTELKIQGAPKLRDQIYSKELPSLEATAKFLLPYHKAKIFVEEGTRNQRTRFWDLKDQYSAPR
tara:strand:- start:266 stop:763 length:498 start_codon:yes stop_codon:yes gene_type:complete